MGCILYTIMMEGLVIELSYHYNDVIKSVMASQITGLTIVFSTFNSGTDQRKQHSSAPLTFVREIHQWPVNSLVKGPVTWKMFPFDDLIMQLPCGSGVKTKTRMTVLQTLSLNISNLIQCNIDTMGISAMLV